LSIINSQIEKYPLLPYSQLVFDMLQTNPEVYTTRFSLRVDKREVDIERLKMAVETALRNHPVFSMHVDKQGMQTYEPLTHILHGPYHSVDFCDESEYVRIDIAFNRILGDALSGNVWFDDVCRAYQGIPLLPDNYLEYLEQAERDKKSSRYIADKQWLEQEFGKLTFPVHPRTDAPLDIPCIPMEGTLSEDYSDLKEGFNTLAEEQLVSLTAIFSLASALAMMEYNGTDEAALTWAYDGREAPEEQHIYGSLHRDIPFHFRKSVIDNRESVIRLARKQYREGIAHSSYPFTLTKPHTEIWNYALNILVRPTADDMNESIPFPIEVLPEEDIRPAYALLDVEIFDGDPLCINYRYSATHYKPESIRKFASLIRKYVEWLID